MEICSLISVEVTASSAQAGLLSHCQYLPRALKDGQHVPATISLHPSSLLGRSVVPGKKKRNNNKKSLFCLVLHAIWNLISYTRMCYGEWVLLNLFDNGRWDSPSDKANVQVCTCVRRKCAVIDEKFRLYYFEVHVVQCKKYSKIYMDVLS